MIRYFTNRDLSNRFQINLAKWKRWSREFLPPDPLGGMQSGYARQYHPDQAFCVLLGGHLVSDLKFSIPQARKILADLDLWMQSNGYLYRISASQAPEETGIELFGTDCRIFIYEDGHSGLFYTICNRLSRTVSENSGKTTVSDQYLETRIPEKHGYPETESPLGCSVLFLRKLLEYFVGALDLSATHYTSLNNE